MRSAQSRSKGTTLASGLPCLVISSPPGSSFSSRDRQCCLKSETLIVFTRQEYNWTKISSSHLLCPFVDPGLPQGGAFACQDPDDPAQCSQPGCCRRGSMAAGGSHWGGQLSPTISRGPALPPGGDDWAHFREHPAVTLELLAGIFTGSPAAPYTGERPPSGRARTPGTVREAPSPQGRDTPEGGPRP